VLVYEVLSFFFGKIAGKFIAVLLQKMGKSSVDRLKDLLQCGKNKMQVFHGADVIFLSV
jgi:hypothetical protein